MMNEAPQIEGTVTNTQKTVVPGSGSQAKGNESKLTVLLLAASLLIAGILYLALMRATRFGAYHDDGIYVTTAKALAEGQGYRLISLPDEPAQTKYPPFYPFLLSIVWRIVPEFPQNLPEMTLLSVIATLGFLAMSWRYFLQHKYASHWQALIVVILTALNWRTMILATSVYSEMLFALLAVAALHLTEKHERAASAPLTGLAAGMMIGLAFLTRSSGIALVISTAAYFTIKRQWKKSILPVAVASLFVIGWVGWCAARKTSAQAINTPYYTSYIGHLTQVVGDLQAQSGSSRSSVFLSMAVENFVGGVLISVPLVSTGLSYAPFAGFSVYTIGAAISAAFLSLVLFATGFVRSLATRMRLLHIYLVTCLGLYLFWLPGVSYDRFLMPLLPFLLLFIAGEFGLLVSLARRGVRSAEVGGKLSGLLIGLVLVLVGGLCLYGYISGAYSLFGSLRSSTIRAADDAQAVTWIRDNTNSSDTLVCYRDPKYFLYTGHKAVRSFPMTEGYSWEEDQASMDKLAQAVFRIIDEATARYVVVTVTDFELEDRPEQHRKIFDLLIERHPRNFVLVFESSDHRSRIFRVDNIAS